MLIVVRSRCRCGGDQYVLVRVVGVRNDSCGHEKDCMSSHGCFRRVICYFVGANSRILVDL